MSREARGRLETALFLNSSRIEGNEMWMLLPGAQPSLDMGSFIYLYYIRYSIYYYFYIIFFRFRYFSCAPIS